MGLASVGAGGSIRPLCGPTKKAKEGNHAEEPTRLSRVRLEGCKGFDAFRFLSGFTAQPPGGSAPGRYAARVDGNRLVRDGGRRGMERAVRDSGRSRGQGVREECL